MIDDIRKTGDSCGGEVTCIVRGCPTGLGSPVFAKLEAELAQAVMSLPASKVSLALCEPLKLQQQCVTRLLRAAVAEETCQLCCVGLPHQPRFASLCKAGSRANAGRHEPACVQGLQLLSLCSGLVH